MSSRTRERSKNSKSGGGSGQLVVEEMTEVEPYASTQGGKGLNVNRYATKKTIAQGMLDIALLTANASQLKYVLQAGKSHPFYTLMITLISISIALQITTGICMVFLGSLNMNKPKNQKMADILNNVITIKIFLITVINVIISSFGIEHVVEQEHLRDLHAQKAARLVYENSTITKTGSGQINFDESKI